MKLRVFFGAVGALVLASVYGTYRYWHPMAPRPREGKRHIVCIGDSITFGAGVIPFQRWLSYPANLQKLLTRPVRRARINLLMRTDSIWSWF